MRARTFSCARRRMRSASPVSNSICEGVGFGSFLRATAQRINTHEVRALAGRSFCTAAVVHQPQSTLTSRACTGSRVIRGSSRCRKSKHSCFWFFDFYYHFEIQLCFLKGVGVGSFSRATVQQQHEGQSIGGTIFLHYASHVRQWTSVPVAKYHFACLYVRGKRKPKRKWFPLVFWFCPINVFFVVNARENYVKDTSSFEWFLRKRLNDRNLMWLLLIGRRCRY